MIYGVINESRFESGSHLEAINYENTWTENWHNRHSKDKSALRVIWNLIKLQQHLLERRLQVMCFKFVTARFLLSTDDNLNLSLNQLAKCVRGQRPNNCMPPTYPNISAAADAWEQSQNTFVSKITQLIRRVLLLKFNQSTVVELF